MTAVLPPLDVATVRGRPYRDVLALQHALCAARAAGERPADLLLLAEHEPVFTLGRGTKASSLPGGPAALAARGIEVVEIERGGDVTWHGPGQLVGYPILDLRCHRPDLHWYLRTLEDALIDALEWLGLPADRHPGLTGVWTAGRKIASIGIHVRRWVTFHGFALNVTNRLADFDLVVPCGIDGVVMTSVAEELREAPTAALERRVRDAVVAAIGRAFGLAPREAELAALEPAALPRR